MAPTQGRDTRLPQEDAALKRLRPTMVLCPGVAGGAHAWGGCEKRHTVPCFPFTTLVTHDTAVSSAGPGVDTAQTSHSSSWVCGPLGASRV